MGNPESFNFCIFSWFLIFFAFKQFRLAVTMFPVVENTLSDGTDVAGTHEEKCSALDRNQSHNYRLSIEHAKHCCCWLNWRVIKEGLAHCDPFGISHGPIICNHVIIAFSSFYFGKNALWYNMFSNTFTAILFYWAEFLTFHFSYYSFHFNQLIFKLDRFWAGWIALEHVRQHFSTLNSSKHDKHFSAQCISTKTSRRAYGEERLSKYWTFFVRTNSPISIFLNISCWKYSCFPIKFSEPPVCILLF